MDTAEVIHLPVKRKRGRPRGSKNKVFRPDVSPRFSKQQPEPASQPIMGDIDTIKHYCHEIMRQASAKGRSTEIALVSLLHWFRVNYL